MTNQPMTPSITLEAGLEIGYSSVLARLEQSLELSAGTHFLVARNGRGKTTLLRTIAKTLKPKHGGMRVCGMVQYLPEDLRFDGELLVKSILRALVKKAKLDEVLALCDEIELDTKKAYGQLSTGNRRKVSLLVSEFSVEEGNGNILLLDEPFSGLDVFARQAFERLWANTGSNVLRLVSCHPDYDSMAMPSAIMIESGSIRHLRADAQTWSDLKPMMK